MEEADLQLIFHNTKGIFSFLEICFPLYPQPRHRKWWEVPNGAERAAEALGGWAKKSSVVHLFTYQTDYRGEQYLNELTLWWVPLSDGASLYSPL